MLSSAASGTLIRFAAARAKRRDDGGWSTFESREAGGNGPGKSRQGSWTCRRNLSHLGEIAPRYRQFAEVERLGRDAAVRGRWP